MNKKLLIYVHCYDPDVAITPWTRIIEYRWFEFGKDTNGKDLSMMVISQEYNPECKPGDEPYYSVNDEKDRKLYQQYKALTDQESNIIFGGRLGGDKYYDMTQVIVSALVCCELIFGGSDE